MAIIIPIIAGVSGLITGLGGGYYLFDSDNEEREINEKGVINNTVEIETETNTELKWMVRIILLAVFILTAIYCASKKFGKRNKRERRVPRRVESNIETIEEV